MISETSASESGSEATRPKDSNPQVTSNTQDTEG